ncbi:MAG: hypothetical protein H6Q90_4167 [Deltaproteobacteria bacterium]|nr:hypothetical protein [Deltaproteobacteria bacterium]
MTPRSSSLAVLATLAVFAGAAAASPASEKLFRDGRDLLKAGKIPEACDAFAQSQLLEPAVGTLLNLADCREKQGRTATSWALFVEAKELAAARNDKRRVVADQRAIAIKAKLAYITITIAPDRQVEGLVIKRNGLAVDPAQWNTPVALDPGDYVVEATAPKFLPWSTTQPLHAKDKLGVEVAALVPVPVEPPQGPGPTVSDPGTGAGTGKPIDRIPPPIGIVNQAPPQIPPVRHLGLGLILGMTSDEDTVSGARISGGLAVPHGALRAIGSVLYDKFPDDLNDPDSNTKLFAVGLSLDYVWMPLPQFMFGGGLGVGSDREIRNLDRENGSQSWWTLRASPVIVRLLQGRIEVGLHLQYVRTSDRGVSLGLAVVDLFPL